MYKLYNSICQWLLSIIGYVLQNGLVIKLFYFLYIFGILVKYFYNLCLLNIEIHFHFGFHVIYQCKICSDYNDVFLLSQIWLATTFSAVRTMELYCVSLVPCSGSGYKTKLGHTGKVKLQFIVSAFLKRHVGGMLLFIISFGSLQVLKQ